MLEMSKTILRPVALGGGMTRDSVWRRIVRASPRVASVERPGLADLPGLVVGRPGERGRALGQERERSKGYGSNHDRLFLWSRRTDEPKMALKIGRTDGAAERASRSLLVRRAILRGIPVAAGGCRSFLGLGQPTLHQWQGAGPAFI